MKGNTFKTKDWVLIRDAEDDFWVLTQFAYFQGAREYPYVMVGSNSSYRFCIPYNEETKHLLGTNQNYEANPKYAWGEKIEVKNDLGWEPAIYLGRSERGRLPNKVALPNGYVYHCDDWHLRPLEPHND